MSFVNKINLENGDIKFLWVSSHIEIKRNEEDDKLARLGVRQSPHKTTNPTPYKRELQHLTSVKSRDIYIYMLENEDVDVQYIFWTRNYSLIQPYN